MAVGIGYFASFFDFHGAGFDAIGIYNLFESGNRKHSDACGSYNIRIPVRSYSAGKLSYASQKQQLDRSGGSDIWTRYQCGFFYDYRGDCGGTAVYTAV